MLITVKDVVVEDEVIGKRNEFCSLGCERVRKKREEGLDKRGV